MPALEDFTSVLDVPTEAKYSGTIERVARGLRPLSTAPAEDMVLGPALRCGHFARVPVVVPAGSPAASLALQMRELIAERVNGLE